MANCISSVLHSLDSDSLRIKFRRLPTLLHTMHVCVFGPGFLPVVELPVRENDFEDKVFSLHEVNLEISYTWINYEITMYAIQRIE